MQWLFLVLSLPTARVTFEVMLAGFGLEQPALEAHRRNCSSPSGAGGVQPPEASGIGSLLGAARCDRRQ